MPKTRLHIWNRFFEKNKTAIQIYLIYLTFEFAKMDKGENTEKI